MNRLLLSRVTSSLLLWTLLIFTTSAERIIESRSLISCMDNSKFTASLFQVSFNPDTRIIDFDINGISEINSNVTATLQVYAYGYKVMDQILDPCKSGMRGMCPMSEGVIDLESSIDNISQEVIDNIPGMLKSGLVTPRYVLQTNLFLFSHCFPGPGP